MLPSEILRVSSSSSRLEPSQCSNLGYGLHYTCICVKPAQGWLMCHFCSSTCMLAKVHRWFLIRMRMTSRRHCSIRPKRCCPECLQIAHAQGNAHDLSSVYLFSSSWPELPLFYQLEHRSLYASELLGVTNEFANRVVRALHCVQTALHTTKHCSRAA